MKLIFILSIICFSVSVNVKKDTSPKVNYNTMNKDCIPSEECHECSFDELKNDKDCWSTGYKKRIHCVYENSVEKYYSESCNNKIKINSVYIMLIICSIICALAYKVQKNQKENLLKNVFSKLSVLKDNN